MNASSGPAAFHLSLSVSNLARSVAFYESLFGVAAARQEPDYAKFEIDNPALVLSLIPGPVAPGGTLNHVGLRMQDSETLVAVQYRLEAAGHITQRENNVACCHSRQTKFWVSDPDRTLWEVYVLERPSADSDCAVPVGNDNATQIDLEAGSFTLKGIASIHGSSSESAFSSWRHWLGQPIPEVIPHADASLDEVRLEGAFNMQLPPGRLGRLLAEVNRVLKPGALLHIHGLVADRLLPPGRPTLPGPAALVERVPLSTEPTRCVAAAGFVNVRQEPCRDEPHFFVKGIGLRELKLTAERAM